MKTFLNRVVLEGWKPKVSQYEGLKLMAEEKVVGKSL